MEQTMRNGFRFNKAALSMRWAIGLRHGRSSTGVMPRLHALLAFPLVAGCTELPLHVKQQLHQAESDYRNNDYAGANAKLDDILKVFPSCRDSAHAYYLRGLCKLKHRDKPGARADISRCIEISTDPVLTAKAHATLGTLCYEAGNLRDAIANYEKAVPSLPDVPPTDVVRFDYGVCLIREGRWQQGRAELAAVIRGYPSGSAAGAAQSLADWPRDYFSIQCGAFRDRAAAESLVKSLKKKGVTARVELRSRSNVKLYLVLVGQFNTFDQAEQSLSAIEAKVPDAHVAPR
jgi:tetratricopeptide (TPR) repeat protein